MAVLSIITINFNNKEGLEKTIQSVRAQSFSDLEYIVIDGGSTDGSKELIEKYAGSITNWVSEKDTGIYNAMNKGVQLATGKYLQFLNSGDVLSHEHILRDFFKTPLTKDIVSGNLSMIGKETSSIATNPAEITAVHLYESTILHPCTFIRKSLFDGFGLYDEAFKIVADYEFFVRVFIKHHVSYEHRPVTVANFDTSGISNQQIDRLQKERNLVLDMYFTPLQLAAVKALFEIQRNDQYRLLQWMNKVFLFRIPLRVLTAVYKRLRK